MVLFTHGHMKHVLMTLYPKMDRVGIGHGGRRQKMCDPEGCATVLGAVAPPPPLG